MKKITIFTDGSSLGNPGAGGFGAIIISENNVSEIGGMEEKTTNNRMEMTAVIRALEFLDANNIKGNIEIFTDSQYLINGVTKWVFGWQSNGWVTKNKVSVLNKDLWQKIILLIENKEIEWKYVQGHAGIDANERVDEIAVSFANKKETPLFKGETKDYPINFKNLKPAYDKSKNESSNKKAYSYVSMVDDKVLVHKTWAECESRVKGKKAKFKKTFSKKEEEDLINDWLK